ncbi:MAG: carboxypeptidase-like regulatory domain-containing protein [Bacteroidetes bacterium]|nr:carboxypeptidase-like regulatory domain-containing protein [Bacteroidota bacterium]
MSEVILGNIPPIFDTDIKMKISGTPFLVVLIGILLGCPLLSRAQTGDRQLADSLVQVADSLGRLGVYNYDTSSRTMGNGADTAQQKEVTPSVAAAPKMIEYELTGVVQDKATGEGIPFATVFFSGTGVGTPADLDGKFSLKFSGQPSDTLMVTAIGYRGFSKKFILAKDTRPSVLIELNREVAALDEFVFHAGEDPAITLLKKIIAAKPKNNPDRLQNYSYKVYNKLEVDIRNLTRKQFEALPIPMIKQFGFIYNNLDSTSEKQPFLPFYLTESISNYYFRRNPKKTREFIEATQVRGLKNESVDQFLGANYQNVNAYDNFIPVFQQSFVSPISDQGLFYYKYRIKDTQTAYGHPIILVSFRPKRAGENCFYGDFWVVDSSFALQRISLEVPKNANINYVSRVSLYQETAPVHDSLWFTIKDKFIADFNLPYSPRLPGFIGRKTTQYSNVVTNNRTIDKVLDNPDSHRDVEVNDSARLRNDAFWAAARPDSLSKNEQAIYDMVDTLDGLPIFQRMKRTLKFLFGGNVSVGPLDIGPYYNVYSSNTIEGSRVRLGLATNEKLWKDIRLSGYGAYGFKDKAFKYYADAFWIMNRYPRSYLFASYRQDIDRSNNYYDNQVSADNLFSNVGRKHGVPLKFAGVQDTRLEYYKEYYSGFSHFLAFQHRVFDPYAPLPDGGIFIDESGNPSLSTTETSVELRLRYAYKEVFLASNYFRSSLGSKYPIPELRFSWGIPHVLGSAYKYKKISFSVSDKVKIAPLGSLYYNVFAGRTFGTVPYPYLDVAPGNEFYYYNKFAFNMMNRFEFLSDRYAGFNIEHSIGGGIFNYIPYLRKARLRQFWTAKGIIGTLSEANKQLNFTPSYQFKTLESSPYIEIGTGVENILQLFRIDFIWRVTPQPLPTEERRKYFGVFGSVKFSF